MALFQKFYHRFLTKILKDRIWFRAERRRSNVRALICQAIISQKINPLFIYLFSLLWLSQSCLEIRSAWFCYKEDGWKRRVKCLYQGGKDTEKLKYQRI